MGKGRKTKNTCRSSKEADTIVGEAQSHLEELIEEDEITKKAQERAEEILSKAQTNAKEIRLGAVEYADSILTETQLNLKDLIDILDKNRQELRGMK